MKVKIERIPKMTIEEFAEQNGLTMYVVERNSKDLPRFFAEFEKCEIKDGAILKSAFGNGETPGDAIIDYAKQISLQRLVFDPFGGSKRREFWVPHLITNDKTQVKA